MHRMPTATAFVLFANYILLTLVSCKHALPEPPPGGGNGGGSSNPCDPQKVYFQQQVLPILISNCAKSGCHDNASHQDGIVLTSYASVMATGGVRPGNPGSSDLYEAMIETDPGDMMPPPPNAPLSSQQKNLVRAWILQGAQDLKCDNMCDSSLFTYSGAIRLIIENKCQGCHNGAGGSGGVDLSTYNGVKASVLNESLWKAVNHMPGASPMPVNGAKLSDCELAQIRKWIDAGSPNN